MKKPGVPDVRSASVREIAEFWDTHDVTDFADQLEEVKGPIFVRKRHHPSPSTGGKYGNAAVLAVEFFSIGMAKTPMDAWDQAVAAYFPHSKSAREKSCPRAAFLGLCETGAVKHIPAGTYTTSQKNKQYALNALSLLENDESLRDDKNMLWSKVLNGKPRQPNEQMDVVVSLWNAKMIRPKKS
jgi:hypothetical protein